MGLLDVFRPRWKHSNPEVRLEAVKTLDDDEVLAQAASRDEDDRIRRLAIKQLIDPWRLKNVASVQSDEKLRAMALGRARELFVEIALSGRETEGSALAAVRDLDSQEHLADIALKATRAAVRTQALDLVVAKGALVNIVRKSTDPELRRSAVARIKDTDTLKLLACQEKDTQFAPLLLDRLSQAELVEVAHKARHKPVAKMARQRAHLDDEKPAAKTAVGGKAVDLEALKRHARQFQLAREFEALAERANRAEEDDARRAQDMQAEWAAVGADAEIGVRVRIEKAFERWNRVYETAAEAKRIADQKQAASRASAKAKALADRMSEPEQAAPAPAAAEPQSAEDSATPPAAEAAPKDATAPKPERPALSPEMVEAEVAALTTLKTQLQVAVQSDRLRLLDAGLKELRNADRRLSRLPPQTRDALAAEFAGLKSDLTKRIAEVKQGEEWKRWVNVQRLEKLCVQVEVLRDVLPEFPDKEQAPAELATLKAAWRASTGPVPPAKRDELWTRFKTACDAVMTIVVKSRPGAAEAEPAATEDASAVASTDNGNAAQATSAAATIADAATVHSERTVEVPPSKTEALGELVAKHEPDASVHTERTVEAAPRPAEETTAVPANEVSPQAGASDDGPTKG
ncbi:MAG: hypothetical protein SF187_12585 [Deltaproteobacteria bacterium]|nr:hypothetical protein [Deltaproteobacteria bacterium]